MEFALSHFPCRCKNYVWIVAAFKTMNQAVMMIVRQTAISCLESLSVLLFVGVLTPPTPRPISKSCPIQKHSVPSINRPCPLPYCTVSSKTERTQVPVLPGRAMRRVQEEDVVMKTSFPKFTDIISTAWSIWCCKLAKLLSRPNDENLNFSQRSTQA